MSSYYDTSKLNGFAIESLKLPKYLKDYLSYETVILNNAPRTVHNYFISLQTFLRWIKLQTDNTQRTDSIEIDDIPLETVCSITNEDIFEFLTYCSGERQNGASSRASKLSALKSFYKYLINIKQCMNTDPTRAVSQPKKEKKLPVYLTKDECIRLLNSVEGETPCRDYCIICFFVNIGMRLTELTSINIRDIRGNVLTLRGKGRKERNVFLNKACLQAYEDYLAERATYGAPKEEQALFISKRYKTRITGRSVERMLDKSFCRAGLNRAKLSPHKLRHTAATLIYQNGANLLQVRDILGHENTTTTEIYAHITQDSVRETMENSPLADINVRQQ